MSKIIPKTYRLFTTLIISSIIDISCNSGQSQKNEGYNLKINEIEITPIAVMVDSNKIIPKIGQFTISRDGEYLFALNENENSFEISRYSSLNFTPFKDITTKVGLLSNSLNYKTCLIRHFTENELILILIPYKTDGLDKKWNIKDESSTLIIFYDLQLKETKRWNVKIKNVKQVRDILENKLIDQMYCNSYQVKNDTIQFIWNSNYNCQINNQQLTFNDQKEGVDNFAITESTDDNITIRTVSNENTKSKLRENYTLRFFGNYNQLLNDSLNKLVNIHKWNIANTITYRFKEGEYFCPIEDGFFLLNKLELRKYKTE